MLESIHSAGGIFISYARATSIPSLKVFSIAVSRRTWCLKCLLCWSTRYHKFSSCMGTVLSRIRNKLYICDTSFIYTYIYKVKEVGNQLGAAKTVSTATYPRKLDSQSFRRLVTINFQISLGAMKHMDRLRLSQTVSCSVSFWAALLGVITTLAGLRIVVPQKQRRRSPGKLGSNPRGQAAPVWR